MILRKRKVKKDHHPLTLNWNQTKKLLLVKDLTNYLIESTHIISNRYDILKQEDLTECLRNKWIRIH